MDSNIAENIVLYDWLSFTSKVLTVSDFINALGLGHVPWTDTKGARGYRDRKYFGAISIHYNGRDDMGIWCEMSGQGCRTFESLSTTGWDSLFQYIRDNGLKITRLDVAYDDHTGVLDIHEVVNDTQCGMFISRSDYWETVLSSKGSTVQIGSSKSKVLIRIYDKAMERGKLDQHWVRCEIQMRDDRATQFTKIPLPIGQAFAGVLLNYLRYVEPIDTDENRWRWPMRQYWSDLVDDAEKISIYRTPGMEYNEECCKNYVINQAGNAIDACIQMYGQDEFVKMIEEREVMPNPKYAMIVKQHQIKVRHDELCRMVAQWFGKEELQPVIYTPAIN